MKDVNAFNKKSGTCYVSEAGTKYTYKDYIKIAKKNEKLSRILFDFSNWQHPETIFEELLREGEIDEQGNALANE